eukprot:GDKI01032167.1.p1 GENE.GDKI01032167.1~~GDKI01032167.1.p1  ORF type:complete len:343 (+),score=87.72 GDKI01032167.1:155-1030(+)
MIGKIQQAMVKECTDMLVRTAVHSMCYPASKRTAAMSAFKALVRASVMWCLRRHMPNGNTLSAEKELSAALETYRRFIPPLNVVSRFIEGEKRTEIEHFFSESCMDELCRMPDVQLPDTNENIIHEAMLRLELSLTHMHSQADKYLTIAAKKSLPPDVDMNRLTQINWDPTQDKKRKLETPTGDAVSARHENAETPETTGRGNAKVSRKKTSGGQGVESHTQPVIGGGVYKVGEKSYQAAVYWSGQRCTKNFAVSKYGGDEQTAKDAAETWRQKAIERIGRGETVDRDMEL